MPHLKTIALLLAGLALPALAQAATLTVTVEEIAKTEGTLRIGVYAQDGYDTGVTVTGANVVVDAAAATASFEDLAPGTYAIKIFHDVDDDGEMGTNPFGLPTEPYAFSNNAKGSFGPPSWDKAKFEVTDAGNVQMIKLN